MGAGASLKETPLERRKQLMRKAVAVSRMNGPNISTFADVVTAATVPSSHGVPDEDQDELADESFPEDDTWAPSTQNEKLALAAEAAKKMLTQAYHKILTANNLFEHVSQIKKSILILKSSLKYLNKSSDKYKMFYLYLLCVSHHEIEPGCRQRIMYAMVEGDLISLLKQLWVNLQVELKKEHGGCTGADLRKFIQNERKTLSAAIAMFRYLLTILWNGTDIRDEDLNMQIYHAFFPLALDILNSPYMHPMNSVTYPQADDWVAIVMCVIHILYNNLRNAPSITLSEMRQKGMLSLVAKYKQGENDHRIKRAAIMAISILMSEEDIQIQSSVIAVTDFEIKFLMQGLEDAINSPDGLSPSYETRDDEIMEVMSHLAMFDGNKKLMIKHGILPLIMKGMDSTNLVLRLASVNCLWALTFDDSVKAQVQKDKQFSRKLQHLQNDSDERIVESAKGALWRLEGEQKHIEEKKNERAKSAVKKKPSGKRTVMLSYNHAHSERVKQIKQRLEDAGFKTWVDYEQMVDDAIQSMVNGIDGSDVVLVCFSEKYMMSQNCRGEAMYAYNTQKVIMAVQVEEDVKPQGWLLMLLGSGFWYDLTKPKDYEKNLGECIAACNNLPMAVAVVKSTPVAPTGKKAEPVPDAAATSSCQSTVRPDLACASWKTSDVAKWLSDNKLDKYKEPLSDMDGELLVELLTMRDDNKELYYELIKDEYGMGAGDVLKFNRALSKLS